MYINWFSVLRLELSVSESRNGQVFGRIGFDLIPDYNNVSIFNVQYAINPNGSRDLQP